MDKDPELKDAPAKNPMAILEKLKLFSKIFVYSHSIIADADQERLRNLFPNRVEFKQKGFRPDQSEKLQEEFDSIKTALINFSEQNKNLEFSVTWSRALNQALQEIFGELATANASWLKVLCETSKEDNGNPILGVVELLNNLLAEQLVQHSGLSASIEQQATLEIEVDTSELSAAKLFQRIYYTKIYHSEIPIMTGDIFDISSE